MLGGASVPEPLHAIGTGSRIESAAVNASFNQLRGIRERLLNRRASDKSPH